MSDEIVDEVRAVRTKIAEACDYDARRIAEHERRVAELKRPGLRYLTKAELDQRRQEQQQSPRRSP